jgi:integrase
MAAVTLTEKMLASLAPPPGKAQRVVRDAEVVGLVVVVGARSRTFAVDYRAAGGARRMMTIGRHGERDAEGRPWNLVRARSKAREILGQVAGGADPSGKSTPAEAAIPTLRTGLELHLANMLKEKGEAGKRSRKTLESETLRLLPSWLERPITDLTTRDLREIHNRVQKGARVRSGRNEKNLPGAALANRLLSHVSAIWGSAHRDKPLPVSNPVDGVTRFELKARGSRVGDHEFRSWREEVDRLTSIRRDLQMLALFTGIRSDGVRHVREEDVDFKRGTLQVERAKGDNAYTVPLSPTTREILERRIRENGADFARYPGGAQGWIFPSFARAKVNGEDVIQALAEPKQYRSNGRTGKKERALAPLHDLRRTYNSVAIEILVPTQARNMLMNHEHQGVNVKHYGFPENWDRVARHQAAIDAALRKRLGLSALSARKRATGRGQTGGSARGGRRRGEADPRRGGATAEG